MVKYLKSIQIKPLRVIVILLALLFGLLMFRNIVNNFIGLQTYTDRTLNFSFQYPFNYTIEVGGSGWQEIKLVRNSTLFDKFIDMLPSDYGTDISRTISIGFADTQEMERLQEDSPNKYGKITLNGLNCLRLLNPKDRYIACDLGSSVIYMNFPSPFKSEFEQIAHSLRKI